MEIERSLAFIRHNRQGRIKVLSSRVDHDRAGPSISIIRGKYNEKLEFKFARGVGPHVGSTLLVASGDPHSARGHTSAGHAGRCRHLRITIAESRKSQEPAIQSTVCEGGLRGDA